MKKEAYRKVLGQQVEVAIDKVLELLTVGRVEYGAGLEHYVVEYIIKHNSLEEIRQFDEKAAIAALLEYVREELKYGIFRNK